MDKTRNRSFDAFARTLLAWWEDIVLNPISCVKAKQFRRTLCPKSLIRFEQIGGTL